MNPFADEATAPRIDPAGLSAERELLIGFLRWQRDTLRIKCAGLDAEQLHHYLDYCSEMLSLTAKTAALCAEHSSDPVVLSTVSTLETLTTELSNKIWQKISLLPRPETAH